jgi:ABC-2 type transport system ATP-binding protein
VTAEAAVRVVGLAKRYGRRTAVDSVDLEAPAGALTAVLGPNGAGKTTTVECCEGLRTPDAGSVSVLGLDPRRDARALRPRVGVLLQDGGLPAAVPAGQVLRHVAAMYARPRPLAELGATLGLDAFARTQVRRLSGGERQRLALAVAIVGRPEVAFLDEPTAGLDPQGRLAVWELVRSLRDEGTTVVLTTHQMADAEALADHVVVVDAGRVVTAGSPTDLVGGGGSVLLTFPTGAGHDAPSLAAGLVIALAHHGAPAVVLRPPNAIEVRAAPDTGILHAITGWAQAEGVPAAITTARRTLEDVFLDLTGRSLR